MKLEILTSDDDRWQAFLRNVAHDFYHRSGYARLATAQDGGQAEAGLVTEGNSYFFLPYVLRSLAEIEYLTKAGDRLYDLTSPYGYPCPLLREEHDGFLKTAIFQWVETMRERGTV